MGLLPAHLLRRGRRSREPFLKACQSRSFPGTVTAFTPALPKASRLPLAKSPSYIICNCVLRWCNTPLSMLTPTVLQCHLG